MKKHSSLLPFLLLCLTWSLHAQTDACVGIDAVILSEDPICAGGAGGAIEIPRIQNAVSPFEITMGDKRATSLVRFVGLTAGIYNILITDALGCTYSETVELVDAEPFVVEAGEDLTVDLGASVEVNPTGNQTITALQWSPSILDTCNSIDCLDQAFFPTKTNTYVMTAISENGCTAKDSILIQVNPIRKVFIPNIFSPNGDGQNDFFTIYADHPNVQQILQVGIFDRWGNQLYAQKNPLGLDSNNLWDGQYRGQLVDRGAYLYFATILFLDGTEEVVSGTVTVIY